MPALTALGDGTGGTHNAGFTPGDLDTSGQIAAVSAYQKLYICDGRPYSATLADSGYHKIDFLNDRLVGTASGAFSKGDVLTQENTEATGIFDETVENAGVGGDETWHLVYRTTTVPFNTTDEISSDGDPAITLTPDEVIYPPHWLNWTLTPDKGEFPEGGSDVMALAFGRIFINAKAHPHQWFATRINDPLDLLLVGDDVASAANSQSAEKAGLVGDTLVAIIPHKDIFTVFGCVNGMYVLRGDPAKNGFFSKLADNTGIFSNTSYCWDDRYNLYFIGNDGLYSVSYDALLSGQSATNLTKEHLPKLVSSMGLNRGTDRVTMVYDKNRYGIQVTASQRDGEWHAAFWIDLRTGGVFPEEYTGGQIPSSSYYFDARRSDQRTCLVGCYDGYVRKWDETVKSDIDDADASVAIDAYAVIGPVSSQNTRSKLKLNELSVRTGIDSDRLTISLYAAQTAAALITDIKNGVTPKTSKTFIVDKLLASLRQKLLAGSIAIKLSNNTVDSSFNIEKIDADISEIGRIK